MITKSDPKLLGDDPTQQEILDFVATNLIKQGRPAVINRDCKYRVDFAGKQLKCAVGWLIPDDMYEEDMDRSGGSNVQRLSGEFHVPNYFKYNVKFLTCLQSAHDMATTETNFVDALKYRLQMLAEEYNLQFNPKEFETAL